MLRMREEAGQGKVNGDSFLAKLKILKAIFETGIGRAVNVSFNDTLGSVIFSADDKEHHEIDVSMIIENKNMDDIVETISSQKIVYIVEKGEYSDRRVVAICSTKKNAEKTAEFFGCDDSDIDEYILDAYVKFQKGSKVFKVVIDKYANIQKIDEDTFDYLKDEISQEVRYIDTNEEMTMIVVAKDEKHAIKEANDFRSFVLASGLWEAGNTWKNGKLEERRGYKT